MKSIKLTLALCALAATGQAQFTGQNFYGHGGVNALLSSGTYVTSDPGFVMGGYLPASPAGSSNFFVDKVDPDGTYGSATAFSREYFLYDAGSKCDNSCLKQETRCYGVSVIENPNANCTNTKYALTAAFTSGILFATLGNNGSVISSAFYNIPPNARPVKPLIALASTGDYYLCGAYQIATIDYLYAMKVDPAGVPFWSSTYDLLGINNSTFTPGGVVEDFYTSGGTAEMTIAGTIGIPPSTDGFIMKLDGSTGTPLLQQALASGQTLNESISSIALSASNGGYILGGRTVMVPGPEEAWMIRLNANATIDWSSRMSPSTNPNAGEVISVAERLSPPYGYEYYGLALSTGPTGGMLVLKLDDLGNPFGQPGNMNNEFLYNDGNGNVALPAAMSVFDAGVTGNNTGIHVFGTDQSAPGQFFLNQACFNGATGVCASTSQQNLTMMNSQTGGPIVTYIFSASASSGLQRCKNHFTLDNKINYNLNQPCPFVGLPVGPEPGNNNRMAAPAGSTPNVLSNAGNVSVYPNPVTNVAEISYSAKEGSNVKISLCDVSGKHIKTIDSGNSKAGANTIRFDMNNLSLQNGVYLINVTVNGTTTQQKIIYTKN